MLAFVFQNRFPKKQGSWRKPLASSSYSTNYNNQYSNQYYRAKGGINFNNNYNNKVLVYFIFNYDMVYETVRAVVA